MGEIVVRKFGGASLATPEQIVAIAKKLSARQRNGEKNIVVVSAMGKTTDSLIQLAKKVSISPSTRELDMLLTTGERVSMALMTMALIDQHCPAISFTGSQAGILTDNSHFNARIVDVRPIRVDAALKENKLVVLAGFQGVNPHSKEITTLGRGGSDTTAVAFAAHFNATRCEILKEVAGVCSSDPNIVPNTKLYEKLPTSLLLNMCFWGAKVLHYRSVEMAHQLGVTLAIGHADTFQIGTTIIPDEDTPMPFLKNEVLAVNILKEVDRLEIGCTDTNEGMTTLKNILLTEQLPMPQMLATNFDNGTLRLMYTSDQDTLSALRALTKNSSKARLLTPTLSSVTLTTYKGLPDDLLSQALNHLEANNITVDKTITSDISLSLFLKSDIREKAAQLLHKKFCLKA
jgi:aspartate kinase